MNELQVKCHHFTYTHIHTHTTTGVELTVGVGFRAHVRLLFLVEMIQCRLLKRIRVVHRLLLLPHVRLRVLEEPLVSGVPHKSVGTTEGFESPMITDSRGGLAADERAKLVNTC